MLGIGIDFAEEFHLVALGRPGEGVIEIRRVEHTPEDLAGLFAQIAELEADPAEVRVVLETRHGMLVEALLDAGCVVVPVNPDLVARRTGPAKKKDDAEDARIACLIALDRFERLRPLIPHGEEAAELRAIARDDERAARDPHRRQCDDGTEVHGQPGAAGVVQPARVQQHELGVDVQSAQRSRQERPLPARQQAGDIGGFGLADHHVLGEDVVGPSGLAGCGRTVQVAVAPSGALGVGPGGPPGDGGRPRAIAPATRAARPARMHGEAPAHDERCAGGGPAVDRQRLGRRHGEAPLELGEGVVVVGPAPRPAWHGPIIADRTCPSGHDPRTVARSSPSGGGRNLVGVRETSPLWCHLATTGPCPGSRLRCRAGLDAHPCPPVARTRSSPATVPGQRCSDATVRPPKPFALLPPGRHSGRTALRSSRRLPRALDYYRRLAKDVTDGEERAWLLTEAGYLSEDPFFHLGLFSGDDPGEMWVEPARPADRQRLVDLQASFVAQLPRRRERPTPEELDPELLSRLVDVPESRIRLAWHRTGTVEGYGLALPMVPDVLDVLPEDGVILQLASHALGLDAATAPVAGPRGTDVWFLGTIVTAQQPAERVASVLNREIVRPFAERRVLLACTGDPFCQGVLAGFGMVPADLAAPLIADGDPAARALAKGAMVELLQ